MTRFFRGDAMEMSKRKLVRGLTLLTLGLLVGCGASLRGKADGVAKLVKLAWENGAYKCAPRELTLAEANLRFARDHLRLGNYHNASEHMALAERFAREAIRKSPKDKCAPPKVVEAPPPRPRPVKVVVKVTDRDKDGIPDTKDACPDDPEDKDGFADADGCPEPDNDGDGICDDHPDVQGRLRHFAGKCEGRDKCTGTEADKANGFAKTKEDKDGFEDGDGCPDPDNDGDKICDGNPDIQGHLAEWAGTCQGKDQCSGADADKANNFANTKETYNNYQDTDGCPDKLRLVVVTAKRIEIKQKIYFDFNKARIKPVSYPVLDEVAKVLLDHPSMRVEIQGHTDSRGSRRYNKRLSQRRAEAVRRYLIRKGVDPGRLIARGYGEDRPIATNRTAAGREKNRRVEFHILSR